MIGSPAGFHIEPTNICTLKCPGCARTRFIQDWPQHWANCNLDIDQVLNFLDVDLTGKYVLLCGNYGDPIYHPDFHQFVQGLKQRQARIEIITNGSYRTQEWWRSLVDLLDAQDTITFSIDGLPENFTEYRINADWDSIKLGIDICTQSKVKTVWKYIPFAYNQIDIATAQQLSQDLGFDEFKLDPSDRFDEATLVYKPADELIGSRLPANQGWKQGQPITDIKPKCDNNTQHFISAAGYYTPCCFLADFRFYYKTDFGLKRDQYKINSTTLSAILTQPKVVDFYNNLAQHSGCQYNCPKVS